MSYPQQVLPAFVLGNGTSRAGFDLAQLRGRGLIIGCNGIFREFAPDILIAIDPGMISEISASSFPAHRVIVPPEPERLELSGTRRASNAGMNAMIEALKRGHQRLVCLGFDFLIEGDETARHTMYDGTPGYDPARRATDEDNVHRARYLQWFATTYAPGATFDFVFPRRAMSLRSFEAPNIRAMYYDDLMAEFGV